MKHSKIMALVLALAMVFTFVCVTVSAAEAVTQIYVAPNGDDAANGAINAPVKTLEAARDLARKQSGKVIINLRGGTYTIASTLELTSADSNTTYRAYKDEKVVITAAYELDAAGFQPAGEEVKAKLLNQRAVDKVKVFDLKAAGITEYGKIKHHGHATAHADKGYDSAKLFQGETAMVTARFPNEGFLLTGNIVSPGTLKSEDGFAFSVDAQTRKRMASWAEEKDAWVFGYFMHDWADYNVKTAKIDAKAGTIKVDWTDAYGLASDRRYYAHNLLCELDAPGEWYLDRETGKLYVYPVSETDKFEFTTFEDVMIKADKLENVTFKNIHFTKSAGKGVVATDVVNMVFDGCEFSLLSDICVTFQQSDNNVASTRNSGVKNSYFHDLGNGCVYIYAGERNNLTPGNCFATNNHMTRFGRIKTTYANAVYLANCGNIASHNEINDAYHQAIYYKGNNQVVEYNEIYNVCTTTADCGAIYCGRDWTTQGNEVRYNYIHDMKLNEARTGMKVQAIYLDDTHSSSNVHGNVFYNVSSIALCGGGRYNKFQYNLMLESDEPFRYDNRGMEWTSSWLKDTSSSSSLFEMVRKKNYKTGVWAEQYPYFVNILEDEPLIPKHNVITDNVIYKTPDMEIDPNVVQYGTVKNNIEISSTKSFKNYAAKDFTLVDGCEILEKIPDFERVDYSKIGRYEVTEKDTDFEEGAAAPAPAPAPAPAKPVADAIKVLLNGEAIDFADVAPQIINDRTMVPLRAIFEALGATVEWDDKTKTVTAKKDDVTIKMTIGAKTFSRNEEKVELDSPATIVDSRTLVPVRAIAESFGSKVGWIAESKTVTIEDVKEEVKEEAKDEKAEEKKDEKSEEKSDEKKDEKAVEKSEEKSDEKKDEKKEEVKKAG